MVTLIQFRNSSKTTVKGFSDNSISALIPVFLVTNNYFLSLHITSRYKPDGGMFRGVRIKLEKDGLLRDEFGIPITLAAISVMCSL